MIRYQLRCAGSHEFEGWFRSSSAFEEQAERGLLTCPFCGTAEVDRALMAPAVKDSDSARRSRRLETGEAASAPVAAPAVAGGGAAGGISGGDVVGQGIPDVLLSALRRLRQQVETHCEDVGDRFADEALRIHHGDAEDRGIYGNMSDEDRERLEDEGVEVQRLPWVSRAES